MKTDSMKYNQAAVAKLDMAIEQGHLVGYTSDDPFLASLLWIVASNDHQISDRCLFQSLAHQPQAFAIEDIRNCLFNLGLDTELNDVTRSTWQYTDGPAILLDHAGHPYVRATASQRPVSPTTAKPGPAHRKKYKYILSLPEDAESPESTWLSTQMQFLRRDLARLLIVKLMLTALSLTIALGIIAIYQLILPTQAFDTLVALALGLGGVLIADYAFRCIKAHILAEIAERTEYALATSLVKRVINMPYDKVIAAPPAQQAVKLRQLMSASVTFSGPALDVLLDLPFALIMLCVLAYFAPLLATVPFALTVLLLLMAAVAIPELRRREATASVARASAGRAVAEVIQDRKQIQADGREALVFANTTRAAREAAIAVQRYETLQRGLESAASAAGPLAGGMFAIFGALLVIAGDISVGVLLGGVIISWRILSPIQSGSQVVLRLSEMFERARAVNAMMEIDTEDELPGADIAQINGRSIAFDRLICRYPGGDEAVLKGVSANIPQGALVAVTGHSGAGKTTLLRAITRLTPARGGRVLVGGLNVIQVPVSTLRRSIVYVPARPHIIHGTIEQNLRLGNPGASLQLVEEVCAELGILRSIKSLPAGLQTLVTTRSEGALSSGFLQSLAIARAILMSPDALLLDEPVVGMDDELEAGLLRTLEKLRGAHTVLMVTHRPSHIRFCDYELRLDRGQITCFEPVEGEKKCLV